jgi:hypothetical protein
MPHAREGRKINVEIIVRSLTGNTCREWYLI